MIGIFIFLVVFLSVFLLRVKISDVIGVFGVILKEMCLLILIIGVVLVFVYVVNYSGMSVMFVLVLVDIGYVFIFFLFVVGWFGVFLIGSDISFNFLFGFL